jgi:hypothetical protein
MVLVAVAAIVGMGAGYLVSAQPFSASGKSSGRSAGPASNPSSTSGSTSTAVELTIPDSIAAALQAAKASHEDADDLVWDASSEKALDVVSEVKITEPGNYRLSGSATEGQIEVNVTAKGIVRLILDGVSVTSTTGPALNVEAADKVLLYLAEGSSNQLTGTPGTEEPDAAVFSKVDLTIAGPGALQVTAKAGDGITSKDGLVIDSGQLTVTAADDAVKGRDYLIIRDGELNLTAEGDALKSTNDEDEGRGYLLFAGGSVTAEAKSDCVDSAVDVFVSAGTLTLSCEDDGIHAERVLMIEGGEIDITKSYEGLEGAGVVISDGKIKITSSDDGINAANGTSSAGGEPGMGRKPGKSTTAPTEPTATPTDPTSSPTSTSGSKRGKVRPTAGAPQPGSTADGTTGRQRGGGGFDRGGGGAPQNAELIISGGEIEIVAGGDGLDSNGNATISGGTITIISPDNVGEMPIDVVGTYEHTGGTITANGQVVK